MGTFPVVSFVIFSISCAYWQSLFLQRSLNQHSPALACLYRPAICYKLSASRHLKMPKCPQKRMITKILFKLDIFWHNLETEGTLSFPFLHNLYDSRFFFIIPNCKVPIADSKIWWCLFLIKNVRNFHKKCPHACTCILLLQRDNVSCCWNNDKI